MSGSEDGQLRSPRAEHYFLSGEEEQDTDSLDIKPPQASASHSRDSFGSKRKERSNKEKKHSKEKRHKDRSGRERDREKDIRSAHRRADTERRDHRKDEGRNDLERYYQRSGYEHEENPDRRYQKHYERPADISGGGRVGTGGNHSYHNHHYQQYHHPMPMHMQHQRQEYYDRPSYHHGGNNANDYHNSRMQQQQQQQYGKHGSQSGHSEYLRHDDVVEMQRDRRKYGYEQQKDGESLEQDLRTRLISKRHKYVNEREQQQYEILRAERRDHERMERERAAAKKERHKMRREKERDVIEVLDSPEVTEPRKHKRHSKSKYQPVPEKRKSPDDPELLARRAKILAAEREKEKRKEVAREELEARRELRKERNEVDVLSPSAVAASVTAGLNVITRKRGDRSLSSDHVTKHKRVKETKSESDGEVGKDSDSDSEEDDEEDSESSSESGGESANSFTKLKPESKKVKPTDLDTDGELHLPESPLSIGELSKSPKLNKKKKRKHKRSTVDNTDDERSIHSNSGHSRTHSESRSPHTRSRSPISRSRSGSHSEYSHSSPHESHHSPLHSSRSRSVSRSRSRSRSLHSRSRSRSISATRSRTRSEERDMVDIQEKPVVEPEPPVPKKKQGEELPACDENGVPLPNYFPGIQGCRSVEEFQCLNRIEEGTYGVVYRAKDKRTQEIVALKRLKMEKEKEGFPITSLREINTLLKGQHPNIVTVREIVVGSNMDKIFIVMDYVEHDLKSLMETMKNRKQSFFPGEVKCLTQQLLRAVGHLHDNWILHRDLKTSNLLLSHKGILKVGDFGLAREYGSPLKKYTSLVVTLWYRAPELLLCSPEYSTPIDIWSVGCIFAEFLQMLPLFPGKSEIDQLNRIFKELGTPNEKIWPGYKELPAVKNLLSQNSQFADYPVSNLRKHFNDKTTEIGISFLQGLLTYDPKQRLTADAALKHPYFKELPLPIDPSMFPTWPAKSELGARKALASSPKPPSGGSQFKQLGRDDIIAGSSNNKMVSGIITGNKKTATNTGFVLHAGTDQRQLAMGPGFNLRF